MSKRKARADLQNQSRLTRKAKGGGRALGPESSASVALEGVLQSKLNGAPFTSRKDAAKCRRSERRGRVAKVGLIKEIEEFCAELKIMSFVQSEVLVHPKIHIVQPW